MAYYRTLKGTEGADYYRGDAFAEKLLGRGGDDDIGGGGGDDYIDGGDGNDLIEGGTGADILIGGKGVDAVSFAYAQNSADGGVQVDLLNGYARDFADGTTDSISGFEVVIGSYYSDTIFGSLAGDDLRGGAGDDFLAGDAGNDTLRGDAGFDVLDGEEGFDFADYFYGAAGTISLRAGTAVLIDGDRDVLRNIEGVHGSQGHDTIIGDRFANELWGEIGNDILRGGAGDDRLIGGFGNDRLTGGLGADTLWGAEGADRFIFVAADTWVSNGGGADAPTDRIADFSHGEGDRIVLRVIDADLSTSGNAAFRFVGEAAFSGHAGELRWEVAGGDTLVQADRDGDGTVDYTITLTGEHALVASDFVL